MCAAYREPPQDVAGGADGNVIAGARPESDFDAPPPLRVALDRDVFPFQLQGGRARDHITGHGPERLHKEVHDPAHHEVVSKHFFFRPRRQRCHHNIATSSECKAHLPLNTCEFVTIKMFNLDLLEASHLIVGFGLMIRRGHDSIETAFVSRPLGNPRRYKPG